MIDLLLNWFRDNGTGLLVGIGSATLLALIKPLRDAAIAGVVNAMRWLGAFVRSIPNHLALRGYVLADKPLWGYRKPGNVDLRNAPPTITVMNFKGGVGKTTLAANLAASFATRRGFRVLLIDLDYQGSLSELLRPATAAADTGNLVAKIIGREEVIQSIETISVPAAELPGVRLVSADYELSETEDNQLLRWLLREHTRGDVRSKIARLLTRANLDARGQFDLVIMDAPPRLSLAAANALRASQYVIIPTKLQPLSALPVSKMISYLDKFRSRIGASFQIAGVVCCMTSGSTAEGTETAALAQINDTLMHAPDHPSVFGQYVPDRVDIGRPQGARIGYLLNGAKGDAVRAVFDALADQIAARMNLPAVVAQAAE